MPAKIKKIFIISPSRFPSEKADSIFIIKSCEAFAERGIEIELMAPRRANSIKDDPFEYYNIKKNFKLKYLFAVDFFPYRNVPQKIAFFINIITFSISCFFYLLFNFNKNCAILSNERISMFLPLLFFRRVFFEMHDYPNKKTIFNKLFFKRITGIIATNKWKRDKILEDFSLSAEKLLYAPNSVDIKKFNINISRNDARIKTELPDNRKIISYIGKYRTMGMEKGVREMIETFKGILQKRPESYLLIVGINEDELGEIEDIFKNLGISADNYKIVLHVHQNKLIYYMKASDVFIMNYPWNEHYAYYMSPMKMFEYMACGRPIVATNLPSITEILNNSNSVLVQSDNPASLGRGIMSVLDDEMLAGRLASMAFENVRNNTWNKRAEKILRFMEA